LPPGLSPAEEARWWDDHHDYWDSNEGEDERLGPSRIVRTRPVNIRLPVDMIEALKDEAARRALPYQTLLRVWLRERLDAEARQHNR